MVLKNDFVDGDAMATAHAGHHNALATAVNTMGGGGIAPRVSGRYYDSILQIAGASSANATFLSNGIRFLPFPVPTPITVDRIGLNVVTAGTTANQVRLGIYNDTGGNPSTLLLDAGLIDTSTTGAKELTISQLLPAGFVWLAMLVGTGAGNATGYSSSTAFPSLGHTSYSDVIANGWVEQTGVTFASGFPNPAAPTGLSGAASTPIIRVRVA